METKQNIEEIFMNEAKKNYCPDEIRPHLNEKIDKIRDEYDKKFMELIEWFWVEVDKETSIEEKKLLFNQLSEGLKEEILDIYNKNK